MSNARKFTVPLLAESLIKGLQIAELPINPKVIARGRGIEVVAKPMETSGCSGMLIRYGNEFAIAYATHFENEGFENFSVAHELGHYYLPGHMDSVIGDEGTHVSRAGFTSNDKFEREADQFAAAFLMPRQLFFPQLIRAGSGLNAIIALAEICKTSLHSTAIRYTECTRDPVAIIISENNIIDHCFMSPAIKSLAGLDWAKRGQHVPDRTMTFSFNRNKENIIKTLRIDGTSHLQHWFGGRWDIEVQESVKGLGAYGKTLTVLHDIEIPDSEDEEFERELIESWTPRFR